MCLRPRYYFIHLKHYDVKFLYKNYTGVAPQEGFENSRLRDRENGIIVRCIRNQDR